MRSDDASFTILAKCISTHDFDFQCVAFVCRSRKWQPKFLHYFHLPYAHWRCCFMKIETRRLSIEFIALTDAYQNYNIYRFIAIFEALQPHVSSAWIISDEWRNNNKYKRHKKKQFHINNVHSPPPPPPLRWTTIIKISYVFLSLLLSLFFFCSSSRHFSAKCQRKMKPVWIKYALHMLPSSACFFACSKRWNENVQK